VWGKEKFIEKLVKGSQRLLDDCGSRVPGRIIWIWLPAEVCDRPQKWRRRLGAALVQWASWSLAALPAGYSKECVQVPDLPGGAESLEIGITVDPLRADSEVQKLDAVAVAYTSGLQLEGEVHFFVWYPQSNEWDTPWIRAFGLSTNQLTGFG
jgi:hypothetical protein